MKVGKLVKMTIGAGKREYIIANTCQQPSKLIAIRSLLKYY